MAALVFLFAVTLGARACAEPPAASPFKLAFVSNREHYWYPHIYLYEHDGDANGKMIGAIDAKDKRLDHQPVLTADGKTCIFGREIEAEVGRVHRWDLTTSTGRDLGELFKTPNAVFSPSISSDGGLLALSAWNRPGSSPRWDVLLYDVKKGEAIELPGLNSTKYDERRAGISGDGKCLAYTTNAPDGLGLTDIRLYNLASKQVLPMLEMNSIAADTYPTLSGDGKLVAFASDREGGQGGLDIYLYDRGESRFDPLPGLNSPGHEQSPSISQDGRLIAFVSERFDAPGEHDIFVYDRARQRLLDTPSLNTDRDDFDPCLVAMPAQSVAKDGN